MQKEAKKTGQDKSKTSTSTIAIYPSINGAHTMGTKTTFQIRSNQRCILDPTRAILVATSSDLVIMEMSHASLRIALGVNTEPPTATASLGRVTFTWHIARALILFGTPVE